MNASSVLLALLLAIACALCRPQHARCPNRFDLRTGIRPSGFYECWPKPVGSLEYDGTFEKPELSYQSDFIIRARIYCTNGYQPVVVQSDTVGCQRDYTPPY